MTSQKIKDIEGLIEEDIIKIHIKNHKLNNNNSLIEIKKNKNKSDPLKNTWAFDKFKLTLNNYKYNKEQKSKKKIDNKEYTYINLEDCFKMIDNNSK